MPTDAEPIIGSWYQHSGKGQKFEVVAVDEDSGVVQIQHFDGDVEEIDLDNWFEMDIESIEAPEDWTAPMDAIVRDDLGVTETDMQGEDWERPLEGRRRKEDWEDDDEEDRWGDEDEDDEGWEERR